MGYRSAKGLWLVVRSRAEWGADGSEWRICGDGCNALLRGVGAAMRGWGCGSD